MDENHEGKDPENEVPQKHPIVERISNGELGRIVCRDDEGPYPLIKVAWVTGGTSWVFAKSIRNVR